MEAQGIYQWNKAYPNLELINNDIKTGTGYVIREKNDCIAYVAINEEQSAEYSQIDWSIDASKVLVIHRLSVHPNSQGKGIARRLMDFIEDFAKRNQYSCIRLDAYSGNITALRLYDRMGYQRLGQVFFPFRDLPFYCYEKVFA
jgi:ribosomal protein S18 acetylase RimI-like enzyme